MTITNTSDRMLITDSLDVNTVFDTDNNMPHYLGEGSFSGVVSSELPLIIGVPVHTIQSWGVFNYNTRDSVVQQALGIFETNSIDFIIAKIRINSVPKQGRCWFGFRPMYTLGNWYLINGSMIIEHGIGYLNDPNIYLLRAIEIVKIGNEFILQFRTSSKAKSVTTYGSSSVAHTYNTELDVDIKIYWGKFT